MWNLIVKFYKSHKYVVLWTAVYFIAVWAIMNFMFDFNILSAHRWYQLAHAHLRGFPGFVFGILILATIPMYVATTIVIARTKAPLFTIKVPEIIKKAFNQTPMDEEVSSTTKEIVLEQTATSSDKDAPAPELIPASVPNEIRTAYARAREHIGRIQTSAFDLGHTTKASTDIQAETAPNTDPDIPIPTDFDIDDINNFDPSVPQFTSINFDDDEDDDTDDENTPDVFETIHELTETLSPIVEYLKSKSRDYSIDGDVVISDKYAIVAHTDKDFWVADTESWFAAGKTRPSPIKSVKSVAMAHNVEPVLYIESRNIMDIDDLIPQWESDGIRVITDLNDLF